MKANVKDNISIGGLFLALSHLNDIRIVLRRLCISEYYFKFKHYVRHGDPGVVFPVCDQLNVAYNAIDYKL